MQPFAPASWNPIGGGMSNAARCRGLSGRRLLWLPRAGCSSKLRHVGDRLLLRLAGYSSLLLLHAGCSLSLHCPGIQLQPCTTEGLGVAAAPVECAEVPPPTLHGLMVNLVAMCALGVAVGSAGSSHLCGCAAVGSAGLPRFRVCAAVCGAGLALRVRRGWRCCSLGLPPLRRGARLRLGWPPLCGAVGACG